jgi:hypothetical protein
MSGTRCAPMGKPDLHTLQTSTDSRLSLFKALAMSFDEVKPEHFNTLSRTPFPHVLIEQALLQVGGGGVDGSKFAKQALTAAGWKHASVVSYGKYADEAAAAFNKIRGVFREELSAGELLEQLK